MIVAALLLFPLQERLFSLKPGAKWQAELTWRFTNKEEEFEQVDVDALQFEVCKDGKVTISRQLKEGSVDGVKSKPEAGIEPFKIVVGMDTPWPLPGSQLANERALTDLVLTSVGPNESAYGYWHLDNGFEPFSRGLKHKEGKLWTYQVTTKTEKMGWSAKGLMTCDHETGIVVKQSLVAHAVKLPGGTFSCELAIEYRLLPAQKQQQ